eukprot:scaffold28111_cov60-Attheya_sp.AAC.1
MKTFTALTSLLALLSIQSAVGNKIEVTLGGGKQVPPVASTVTGTAAIELLSDGTIECRVSLLNPDGVALLGAHIHCGEADANGPVVAVLAPSTVPVEFSTIINATGIVDTTCGDTIALLYANIEKGRAYVSVHSTENPSGEVRGQLESEVIEVTLGGGEQVPPIASTVTGTAKIELLSDGTIECRVSLLNPDGVALL